MEIEDLQEGWVHFKRIPFAEGFIDRWVGDCINNPNNQYKGNWVLNGDATYIRLNGEGLWFNMREFNKSIIDMINHRDKTAEEVWNEFLIKNMNDEE